MASKSLLKLKKTDRLNTLRENLNNNNVNLRVARNLLKRYKTSSNGLIVKATDLFMKTCDEQIAVNDQEKDLLEGFFNHSQEKLPTKALEKNFLKDQRNLALQRKESSKEFLKASLLVSKLLVSNKEDRHGELIYLGLTNQERNNLIGQLNQFSGNKFKGKLRQGQSFLEGSITAIRQVLEDASWSSLDG